MDWTVIKRIILLFAGSYLLSSCSTSYHVQTDWAETGLYEDGKETLLEVVIAKPRTPGPYPTLIFNHGSTGNADPKIIKTTAVTKSIADYFTQRGWLVAFPQRRGRGNSGGQYDEGLNLNRSGYSCRTNVALQGMERALQDIDSVVEYLKAKPEVDSKRMLIGGASRGGLLSIVYAGTRPHRFKGAINFVGGWKNDRCVNVTKINTESFKRGANFDNPTLWLYGLNDQFY